MKKRFLAFLFAITLCFACASIASATIVQETDTPTLVQNADYILTATVLSVEYKWDANHTRIITETTVSVSETIKGVPASVIVIQTLGGTLDGLTQHVSGEPSFTVGEKILVFLEKDGDIFRPVSMSLGKYAIIQKNNIDYAVSSPKGLALYRKDAHSNAPKIREAVPHAVPLSQFREEITGFMNSSY